MLLLAQEEEGDIVQAQAQVLVILAILLAIRIPLAVVAQDLAILAIVAPVIRVILRIQNAVAIKRIVRDAEQ